MVSFAPFRKLIQQRGITTYYLRCKCGDHNLGHNTLQRLMTDQSVSTNTIDALCQILSCDVTDLMEITEDPPIAGKNNPGPRGRHPRRRPPSASSRAPKTRRRRARSCPEKAKPGRQTPQYGAMQKAA